MLGGIPTSSVKRVLKAPNDEQPTAKAMCADPSGHCCTRGPVNPAGIVCVFDDHHGQVIVTRPVTLDDVPALAELLRVNRDFLAPWEPIRDDDYFTVDGQRTVIQAALERHQEGSILPHVIVDDSCRVVGRITLNEIVRGPFQSCSLGYWVNASDNGRGVATVAVRDIIRVAFEELGLHRIQAGTLLHNVRSQRVLEHNGFLQFGVAPEYLKIAGKWQDHALYQVVKLSPA